MEEGPKCTRLRQIWCISGSIYGVNQEAVQGNHEAHGTSLLVSFPRLLAGGRETKMRGEEARKGIHDVQTEMSCR